MLYSLLEDIEKKYKTKTLWQIKRDGNYVKYSYQEVMQLARNLAQRLQKMGVRPGSHIALCGESVPEWAIAYLGIHFTGAVVVPLDIQLSSVAMENLLQFCDVKILLCSSSIYENAKEISSKLELDILTLDPSTEPHSIFQSPEKSSDFAPHIGSEDDTMSLIFTSGTTGDPKGVMLSFRNFYSSAQAGGAGVLKGTDRDVLLCVLPLHHCYAFSTNIFGALILGATTTFQPILKGPEIISARSGSM